MEEQQDEKWFTLDPKIERFFSEIDQIMDEFMQAVSQTNDSTVLNKSAEEVIEKYEKAKAELESK